jgi:uncharacterized protein (DUF1330 family)
MAAYVMVNIDVTDPARYADYIAVAGATVAAFGGEYLARGGAAQRLEGSWNPKRVVILRFDSVEAAKAWWSSDAYAGPKAMRQAAAITDMMLVDGV